MTFASRGAHRLAYKSQRETPFARSISRAWKARRRLGDHQSIGATIEKPPGMRWRTFDRLLEKVEAAEGMMGGHASLLVEVLIRETGEQELRHGR